MKFGLQVNSELKFARTKFAANCSPVCGEIRWSSDGVCQILANSGTRSPKNFLANSDLCSHEFAANECSPAMVPHALTLQLLSSINAVKSLSFEIGGMPT